MPLFSVSVAIERLVPSVTAGLLPPVRSVVSVLNCWLPVVKFNVPNLPLDPPTVSKDDPPPVRVPEPVTVPFKVTLCAPILKAQDVDSDLMAATAAFTY